MKIIKHYLTFVLILTLILSSCCWTSIEELVREDVNEGPILHKSDTKTIDVITDHFRVTTQSMYGDDEPSNVPSDAIEYGLIEFAGLNKDYQYFNRIVLATKEALILQGYAMIYYMHNKALMIQISYHRKTKHLEFLINEKSFFPESYAIDLSNVDVSLK